MARVHVGAGFVAVTREATSSWDRLGPALVRELEAHVRSGEAWIDPALAPVAKTGDGESDVESRILAVLEREVRPAVQLDGGDVAYEGFTDGVVHLDLRGACAGCPASAQTLREGIERRLREAVPEVRAVQAR